MKRWILLAALAAGCADAAGSFHVSQQHPDHGRGPYALHTMPRTRPARALATPLRRLVAPVPRHEQEGEAGGYFTVITRDDGKRQWAFDGKPLYFNATDSRPGDRKGGGVGRRMVGREVTRTLAHVAGTPVGTPSMGMRYEGS